MTTEIRIAAMRAKLTDALNPVTLEISDESHHHVGHEGAKSGKGHFHVKIVAEAFQERSAIQRHRLIYQALGDLMDTDIHALSIEADTP